VKFPDEETSVSILSGHAATLRGALDDLGELEGTLQAAASSVARSLTAGGKLLAAGNGGSAAEAQHLTAELLGRLHPDRERRPLAAVALHADTSTLTAVGNDYGYDEIFARQVEALGRPDDVLVVFSTSGASQNLVNAVDVATKLGMESIGLLGSRGVRPLHEKCTHVLAVPSDSIQAIQECHLVLLHVLVEQAEGIMGFEFGANGG
jgi:D-sedoheptulose 7-phosphate isomerase